MVVEPSSEVGPEAGTWREVGGGLHLQGRPPFAQAGVLGLKEVHVIADVSHLSRPKCTVSKGCYYK